MYVVLALTYPTADDDAFLCPDLNRVPNDASTPEETATAVSTGDFGTTVGARDPRAYTMRYTAIHGEDGSSP